MAQSKSFNKKKFFVKEEEGIYVVTEEFFDDIESREEALVIALRVFGEIHTVLKDESISDGPLYIGNMKVLTGLQRCLDELDRRWPFLLLELRSTPRRINGLILEPC